MEKIKLYGLGNSGERSYFVFEKRLSFFRSFATFLDALNIEKPVSFYEYDENALNLDDVTDTAEHTKNDEYDIDFFYGKNRIVVLIRTKNDRGNFLPLIKAFADFEGF